MSSKSSKKLLMKMETLAGLHFLVNLENRWDHLDVNLYNISSTVLTKRRKELCQPKNYVAIF
jgi:hypothetical protein